MTRIVVAAVGRLKGSPLRDAVTDYELRLRHYVRFDALEIDPARLPDDRASDARTKEAEVLGRRLPEDLELVALTRDGDQWSTRKMAEYLKNMMDYGQPGAVFAIGGAHGLAQSLIGRARVRLSLSPMTLPHEMARLILTEQLYRAGTILRGEPYHKGP